jgi:hypothetical protein
MASRYALATIAASLAITALSASAQSVEDAMRRMHASLARVPHLSDSDLLAEEGSRRFAAANSFVLAKQCASGRANPVVVSSLALKMNLYGSIREDGRFSISPIASGGHPFEIPLKFTTVADFPKEYLRDMSALIETKGLPEELAERLKRELPQNYEKLSIRVEKLMSGFDPRRCPNYTRWSLDERHYAIFVPPTF